MTDLRRSPSLESVSSVQSLASMQSAESINSLISTKSPDERGAKPSDYEDLNDIDMGRTITSIPVPAHPASDSGQGDDNSSSKIGDWVNTGNDGLEPSSATSPSSKPAVKPTLLNTKKHNRFYMDPRTIQLVLDDGTLYRVFRQSFEEHSSVFATQYFADCSEDEPIKLSGVSSVDLDRFLALMYPSELATCELSTADEWISVLRLAHKWSFAALRTRAIREVKAIGTAVDRIASAREFGDLDELQEWLLPAFTETCTASGWLQTTTVDDAERLGAGTLLHIARIREDARQTTKKSSICAIERAIVAAGLAPAPPIETCAEPLALPAYVTPTKPLASAPLEIPSSLCIVSKPTTTLDAQGSGSASPPITPADVSSVKPATSSPQAIPVVTVEQAPTRRQKTNGSDIIAAAPRSASAAIGGLAESVKPPSPVIPLPVAANDPPRTPKATEPQCAPSAAAVSKIATKKSPTPPSASPKRSSSSRGFLAATLTAPLLDAPALSVSPEPPRLTLQERIAAIQAEKNQSSTAVLEPSRASSGGHQIVPPRTRPASATPCSSIPPCPPSSMASVPLTPASAAASLPISQAPGSEPAESSATAVAPAEPVAMYPGPV